MGLTVIGALIPSVVKMSLGLVFKSGEVKLAIQTGVLDKDHACFITSCTYIYRL